MSLSLQPPGLLERDVPQDSEPFALQPIPAKATRCVASSSWLLSTPLHPLTSQRRNLGFSATKTGTAMGPSCHKEQEEGDGAPFSSLTRSLTLTSNPQNQRSQLSSDLKGMKSHAGLQDHQGGLAAS